MILFGASGHAKVIIDILILNGITPQAVFDDAPAHSEILGIPVHSSADISTFDADAIISVGNNRARKFLSQKFPFQYITAIHPGAVVSTFTKIGAGTVCMAGSLINPDAEVGSHCIINTGAVVEHDCIIEDFVHISPNASLAGGVTVGEGSQVGIGACVRQGIKIGKWCVIGAGAVVVKDIPDFAVVVGNPAKIIKYEKHHE